MPLTKHTNFAFNHSDQPNDLYNVETSTEIKANFDSRAKEVSDALDAIIDQLQSVVDSDSGADNIGATAIAGLDGATVQALLEALKTQIDNVTLGQIPDGSITEQKLSFNAADQDILSSTATSEGASLIGIEDASAHFISTNVEGALSELFQFANDGKTNIATVVGSPATTSDTFSELETHIQDAKNTIATNLTNKGQTSTGTEALQALADKIANVSTGKRYATGTTPMSSTSRTGSNGLNAYPVTVTGLSFTPSQVIICYNNGTTNGRVTVYDSTWDSEPGTTGNQVIYSLATNSSGVQYSYTADSTWYANNGGFQLPVAFSSGNVHWIAFE